MPGRQDMTRPRLCPERSWWQAPGSVDMKLPAGPMGAHLWLVCCRIISHHLGDSRKKWEQALPRLTKVTGVRGELSWFGESAGSPQVDISAWTSERNHPRGAMKDNQACPCRASSPGILQRELGLGFGPGCQRNGSSPESPTSDSMTSSMSLLCKIGITNTDISQGLCKQQAWYPGCEWGSMGPGVCHLGPQWVPTARGSCL